MIRDIYSAIETVTGCTKKELRGTSRKLDISRRRNMAIGIMKKFRIPTNAIAFEFSRSKSTIIKTISTHEQELELYGRYAEEYTEILRQIPLATRRTIGEVAL